MRETENVGQNARGLATRLRLVLIALMASLSLAAGASATGTRDPSDGGAAIDSQIDTGVDVVFVLDNSGSMRQNDPEYLTRRAVANFARAMAKDSAMHGRIAIVLFDGRARLVQPLTPIAKDSADRILTSPLSTLDFGGQRTNSPSGIERALYELRENGRAQARKAIIFLSDGKIDTGSLEGDAEASRWLREDLAGESREAGIRIFGVAFTEAADYQLMQALALKTRASYYRAFEAKELDSVVSDVLQQIGQSRNEVLASGKLSGTTLDPHSAVDPPSVASAPLPEEEGNRFEIFGWLPIAIFVAGASLYWGYRRRSDPAVDTNPLESFVDVDPIAPQAQLLDFAGRIGEIGGVVLLGQGRTTIGRDPHNDIAVDNDAISSEHAVIEVRNGRYWLEDRRSTNGTMLGDQNLVPGQPVQLKGGDHIKLGEIELMFVLAGYVPGGATVFLNPATTAPQGWESTSPSENPEALESDSAQAVGSEEFSGTGQGSGGSHISLLPKLEDQVTPGEVRDTREEEITIDGEDEIDGSTGGSIYRNCLDYHLERVDEISPALAGFVKRGFDEEMRDALSVAAGELIRSAQEADTIQQKAYTASAIRYLICAVPDSMELARGRFGDVYGGFTRLLTAALQDESFVRDRCEILAVLTFGQATDRDALPWVSLSIVPDDGEDPRIDLLSYEFLTDDERHEIEAGDPSDKSHSGHA
jgi:Mg-chelatase subunit ChlD